MTVKKKKSPIVVIFILILLCIAAGVLYLSLNIFASVNITAPETSIEAADSCQSKLTKILIDETLAFKYKKTKEIPFSSLELNSWFHEKRMNGQVEKVSIHLDKDQAVFEGLFKPFAKKKFSRIGAQKQNSALQKVAIAFKIETTPNVLSNRVTFEPTSIVLGRQTIPPNLLPDLLNNLNLNPFEKKMKTTKEVRIQDDSLLITVYVD